MAGLLVLAVAGAALTACGSGAGDRIHCTAGDTVSDLTEVGVRILFATDECVAGVALPSTESDRVVVWAYTNRWYVQPYVDDPFTGIAADGRWVSPTHPYARIVALLVSASYSPGATRELHPSLDPAVIAWDELPRTGAGP